MFSTGAPGIKKCPVAPASAIASSMAILILDAEGGRWCGGRFMVCKACAHASLLVTGVLWRCWWVVNVGLGEISSLVTSIRLGNPLVVRISAFLWEQLLVIMVTSSSSSARRAKGLFPIFSVGVSTVDDEETDLSLVHCPLSDGAAPRSQ